MPYFIAEIGSNWRDKNDILVSARKASESGASALKLQVFTQEDLYGVVPDGARLSEMKELPQSWLLDIRTVCDKHKIELIVSTFHPKRVAYVDSYVHYHKLASSELNNGPLIAEMARAKKRTIVSTGCSSVDEIASIQKQLGRKLKAILYCVAAYPSRYIDLANIRQLRNHFEVEIGLSDHSDDVLGIPLIAAKEFKADVIEKHCNFVGMKDSESADAPFSINEVQLAELVVASQTRSRINPVLRCIEEDEFSKNARRKVIALHRIYRGTRLMLDKNCVLARPLKSWEGPALLPEEIDANTYSAFETIEKGDVISHNQIEKMRV